MGEHTLAERLRAVERALADGEHDLADLPDGAELATRVDTLEERVEAQDERIAELEAAVQALRGYVGNVRAVNREVERRADAALATAEALEAERRPIDPPRRAAVADEPERDDGTPERGVVDRLRESL